MYDSDTLAVHFYHNMTRPEIAAAILNGPIHLEVHIDQWTSLEAIANRGFRVGITNVNLSILKKGKAKGVRFDTFFFISIAFMTIFALIF